MWAGYGYSKDRRKFLPASQAAAPAVLARLELHRLDPARVLAGRWPRASSSCSRTTARCTRSTSAPARRVWKRKLGMLAAASPAYGNGRVFVPMLSRGKGKPGAVYALDAKTGKILWKRLLPSRTESSPVFDNDRIYFGSENGTVYSIRAGDGAVRWKFKASGAVKSGLALADGKLYFGDYSGRVYAIRQADGGEVWNTGTKGGALRPEVGHVLLHARGRLRPRLHRQHRRASMYSFSSANGKLAWTQGHRLLRLLLARRGARSRAAGRRSSSAPTTASSTPRRPQRQGAVDAPRRRQDLRRRDRGRRHRLLLQLRQEGHDRPRRAHRPRRSSTWAAARSTPSSPTGARSS